MILRRRIDSLYTAMPALILTYVFAVLFIFAVRLFVSDLPLTSFANVSDSFAKKVMPYVDGFQLLIALWIGTGVVEKFAIKKLKKDDAAEEEKKAKLGKFYLVDQTGALIPKRRKNRKRR